MDWNEEAKRLLPCHAASCGADAKSERASHYATCPGYYRYTLAAALAAAEARGAEEANIACRALFKSETEEISRLKAEVERLIGMNIPEHIARLRAERDAAVVQGLEMALRTIREQLVQGWDGSSFMLNRAIQAEIDKRKGTHEN